MRVGDSFSFLRFSVKLVSSLLPILLPISSLAAPGGAYSYQFPAPGVEMSDVRTVIGVPVVHVVRPKETFLDIARDYSLGYNELEDLYPDQDPWVPPVGLGMVIPSQWVIPDYLENGIVLNIAELRLYYFMSKAKLVRSFPIGIGDSEWQSPVSGIFPIKGKRVNPTWYIPKSLQAKYGARIMPPGPDNPLGDYWMGLGDTSYGIHGTNFPWAVGRLVTHGCIRLYPEDIDRLFKLVPAGTLVKIIYEPVKLGLLDGRVYVEVHKDIYDRIDDFDLYAFNRLEESGLTEKVDLKKFSDAVNRKDGLPVEVNLPPE
jgi:L,D-transpeptidase ErfK/SrfK